MELVYPIIDYCSVCSSGAASSNGIGYSTSIFRNHNLESFRILAWLPIFLQCIMLAHQAALYIKLSTLIEVINNSRKPYWLNESKYLWNVLMCPFVLHAVNSIVASHWHMLIIGSSQLTVLLTPLNLSLINLKMQNLFSDTWFPILQFMLDLELTSLNVRFSAPNFAQRRGTVSWSQHTQSVAADQAPKSDPRDCLGFLAQPLRPLRRVIFYRILLVLKNWS